MVNGTVFGDMYAAECTWSSVVGLSPHIMIYFFSFLFCATSRMSAAAIVPNVIINNWVRIKTTPSLNTVPFSLLLLLLCAIGSPISTTGRHRQYNLSFQVKNFPRESRARLRIDFTSILEWGDIIRLCCYGAGSFGSNHFFFLYKDAMPKCNGNIH